MKRQHPFHRSLSVALLLAVALAVLPRWVGAKIPLQVRQATKDGLDYLARTQKDDGSWPDHYGQSPGVVGLVLLAFLAHGEVPGRGPYKETIDKALGYLLASANEENGLISRAGSQEMYNHGFATLALAEAYGISKRPEVERVLRRAVNLIVRCQNRRGGWRYNPVPADDDITVTGCQLMALRAADNAGINVPRKTIQKGAEYIESCYSYGGFGYQPGGSPNTPRTGIGVLLLQLLGKEDSEKVKKGVEYLKKHPLRHPGHYFFYGTYYCAQAMFQFGGADWKAWNREMTKELLRLQVKTPGREQGSWPQTGSAGGKVFATAMALLALEINWRYLPIYQR